MADTGNRTPWVMVDDFQRDIVSLALEVRNCGTGAGGFKSGNKCAGKGKGGGGGGESDEQLAARPYRGITFEAAYKEHGKKLEAVRKKMIAAHEKAAQDVITKRESLVSIRKELDAVSDERSKLFEAQHKLDSKARTPTYSKEEKLAFLDQAQAMSPAIEALKTKAFELQQSAEKANAEWKEAHARTKTAAWDVLKKDVAAVNKEDGVSKETLALAATHAHVAGYTTATFSKGEKSDQAAASEAFAKNRAEAWSTLEGSVNPTIHGDALGVKTDFEHSHTREFAAGSVFYDDKGGVAMASSITTRATTTASTIVHEVGHHLEFNNVEVAVLSNSFLEKRTAGETPFSMKERFPNKGYEPHEMGREDHFLKAAEAAGYDEGAAKALAAYTGKRYAEQGGPAELAGAAIPNSVTLGASEITSVGMQYLHRDPVAFAKADPEWFNYTIGVASGRLLTKTRALRRTKNWGRGFVYGIGKKTDAGYDDGLVVHPTIPVRPAT